MSNELNEDSKISLVTVALEALLGSGEGEAVLWELERQGFNIELLVPLDMRALELKATLRRRGFLQFFDAFRYTPAPDTILLDRPAMVTMRYVTAALAPRVRTNFWILSKLAAGLTLDKTKSPAEDDPNE